MSKKLTHGGDWAGFMAEYGVKPLDYSSNINPYGVPEGVKTAIVRAVENADNYPDPLCRRLVAKLGAHEGVDPEWITCGNGAADLIFRLALALRPKQALLPAPCFAEYEQALSTVDCQFRYYELKQECEFRIQEDILAQIDASLDIMFLCEPNNPTGVTTERSLLVRILERCKECNVILALDECFNEFLDDPDAHSMKDYLKEYPNLIIFKAFTKKYGIPGVRLGYVMQANGDMQNQMRICGQPWSVSNLAEEAGLACLDETDYWEKGHALVKEQRRWLYDQLVSLGLKVYPGEANYLLFFDAAEPDPALQASLGDRMRREGILIRSCDNYRNLTNGWYRVAVRLPEENLQLVNTFKKVIFGSDH